MEVLLITGLGLLGWSLSGSGTHHRTQRTPPVDVAQNVGHAYPFDPDTTSTLLDRDTAHIAQSIQESRDAINSWRHGPFQSSDKTASVETKRKLDLFTGHDTHAWNHKEAYAPLFDPEEKKTYVTSGGLQRSQHVEYSERDYTDRHTFTGKMNNIVPFAQQRVGPGVGVDPSVPAADGLHSSFRILPTHAMNAHRINQLPGRNTSGAAHIAHGSTRYDGIHKQGPSLAPYEPNVGPGRTSFSGHAVTSYTQPLPTKSDGVNIAGNTPGQYRNAGQSIRTQDLHSQKDQLQQLPMYGDRMDIQAPTQTVSIYDKIDAGTNRSRWSGEGITGTSAVTTHATYSDNVNLRDPKAGTLTYDPTDLMTGSMNVLAKGPIHDSQFVLKETSRDNATPYMTGATAIAGGGTARHQYLESSTGRELPAINTGNASATVKGTTIRSNILMSKGRETANQPSHGTVQGGVFDSDQHPGIVQRKDTPNAYTQPPHGAHTPFSIQRESPGLQVANKKVSSINPRAQPDSMGLGLVCVSDT